MENIFQRGYSWLYNTIEEYATKNDYEITELGNELIGEHFLVLKNDDGEVGSFVLSGVQDGVYLYQCVYAD